MGKIDLVKEDIFKNGRPFFKLEKSGNRKELSGLLANKERKEVSKYLQVQVLKDLDINLVHDRSMFEDYRGISYNCRDWVFDEMGIPEYTLRDGMNIANQLIYEDLSKVSKVETPKKDDIILYYKSGALLHWGIVDSIDDEIRVNSKWGGLDVYNHSMENVPSLYGNYVMFFEKKD